jgi:hypothetical protein
MEGDWVELRSGWIDEARWMKAVLEAAGIDAAIPDEYTPALPLAPGLDSSAVRLLVRSEDAERALEILEASSPPIVID